MCDATKNTVGHVNEIAHRLTAALEGAAAFLPVVAALEREIGRAEEDILPMKMTETNGEVLAHVDGMQQRHRSLATAAGELRRQVHHIFLVAQELQVVQRPFLAAAAATTTTVSVTTATTAKE